MRPAGARRRSQQLKSRADGGNGAARRLERGRHAFGARRTAPRRPSRRRHSQTPFLYCQQYSET